MLKTKQFLCDCKNAQVRQGRPNQHQNPIQSNRTEPYRTAPNGAKQDEAEVAVSRIHFSE